MIKTWLPWIIIAVLLLLIILGIFTRPEPVENGGYVKEYEAQIQRKDQKIDVLTRRIIQDSIKRVKDSLKTVVTLKAYEAAIGKMNKRLRSINTSKATNKELDSLINVLYGEKL